MLVCVGANRPSALSIELLLRLERADGDARLRQGDEPGHVADEDARREDLTVNATLSNQRRVRTPNVASVFQRLETAFFQ